MRLTVVIAGLVAMSSCSRTGPMRGLDAEAIWMGKAFEGPRVAGTQSMRERDYRSAAEHFSVGAKAARLAGDWLSEGRFLANQSGANMMLGENRAAIRTLLAARDAAYKAGDLGTLQMVEANLASVYVLTGDYEAVGAAAARGAAIIPPNPVLGRQVRTLMSFGRAMARARGVNAAAAIWKEALTAAEGAPNAQSLEADVLELWGYELAEAGKERGLEAEELLARAWYKRKLAHDDRLPLTEGKLARLYRKQGKIEEARRWIDRSMQAIDRGQKIPVSEWVMRAEEAHIASDEGRLQAGLDGYRKAEQLAERWREKLPPMDRTRLSAERRMAQELFEGYLETAARLYRKRPSPALAAEMFTVIQNTRAWSLDANGESSGQASPLHSAARRMEARWLAGEASAGARLKALRASILEQEAAVSGDVTAEAGKLEQPEQGEAILTFWLHDEGSWLWLWTDRGLRITELSARGEILEAAEAFNKAIESNDPASAETGLRLRHELLGGLEAECLRARRWDIVADEGLFQVPFGALPGKNSRYLVEDTELRLIPNALRQKSGQKPERRFFAVADPIFNTADERRESDWPWQRAAYAATGLPRLPGTRKEAEAASAAWREAGYETSVYAGVESGEEAVLARLAEWKPGIIHIATHTMEAQGRPRLALTLRGDGSVGLLTAEDIAAVPMHAELVVMSACHSTGTEAAKGSGLLGLTRAWLTAGARQVVSTLWPVGDESTGFFSTFYGQLATGKESPLPVAAALRQAQLACIRGGGSAAQPRNWAGHVLLARR